jgi:hypothetical protein
MSERRRVAKLHRHGRIDLHRLTPLVIEAGFEDPAKRPHSSEFWPDERLALHPRRRSDRDMMDWAPLWGETA